jgi:hypothetical protein
VTKSCRLCSEPAFSAGLCTGHLLERGRSITVARKKAEREQRRLGFFLLRRAARHAGDYALWHELRQRQRQSRAIPEDISPAAKWRAKWVEAGVSGTPASANAVAYPHGPFGEPHSNENRS